MEDGTILSKTPWHGWKVFARKKAEIPLEEWRIKKREFYHSLPRWQKVRRIPSIDTLEKWVEEGIAETPTGYRIEPDGVHPTEGPSWLVFFGMI